MESANTLKARTQHQIGTLRALSLNIRQKTASSVHMGFRRAVLQPGCVMIDGVIDVWAAD